MEYANGVFRQVELHDKYVIKSILVDGSEDYSDSSCSIYSDATPEECMDCQANELGTWRDFPNNSALCPILEQSTLEHIYMPRAITIDDMVSYHIGKYSDDKYEPEIEEYFGNTNLSNYCRDRINTAITVMVDFSERIALGKVNYKDFIKGLSEIYAKNVNVFYNIVEDLHVHNVGILDGRIVVIDYAGCESMYNWEEINDEVE